MVCFGSRPSRCWHLLFLVAFLSSTSWWILSMHHLHRLTFSNWYASIYNGQDCFTSARDLRMIILNPHFYEPWHLMNFGFDKLFWLVWYMQGFTVCRKYINIGIMHSLLACMVFFVSAKWHILHSSPYVPVSDRCALCWRLFLGPAWEQLA